MPDKMIITPEMVCNEEMVLRMRPYISNGKAVITVNTGRLDDKGFPIYKEEAIHTNATLRKDEWVKLDDEIIAAAERRMPIINALRARGLAKDIGGLGVMVSEWESASEFTDATVTMDGESKNPEKDRQEFDLQGVPVPIVSKPFRIGTRTLMASRQRGQSLDITQQYAAARSVARSSENLVLNGANIGAVNSAGRRYHIYGLLNHPARAVVNISNWADPGISPETVHTELLAIAQVMETQERHFGPFEIFIPGDMSFQFRRDYKAFGDKTLMQRILDEQVFSAVHVSDQMPSGNVSLVQMEPDVIDLAVGSEINTVQWESGSGFSNHFIVYAAWVARLKQDFNERCGIAHASV